MPDVHTTTELEALPLWKTSFNIYYLQFDPMLNSSLWVIPLAEMFFFFIPSASQSARCCFCNSGWRNAATAFTAVASERQLKLLMKWNLGCFCISPPFVFFEYIRSEAFFVVVLRKSSLLFPHVESLIQKRADKVRELKFLWICGNHFYSDQTKLSTETIESTLFFGLQKKYIHIWNTKVLDAECKKTFKSISLSSQMHWSIILPVTLKT